MKPVLLSRWVALAVLLLGVTVLSGWVFGVPALTTVLPGLASMKTNTAVCFILSGVALASMPQAGLHARWGAVACALGVSAIGGITMLEHLLGVDAAIDDLLISHRGTPQGGRMALATSAAFVATGVALLMLPCIEHRSWMRNVARAASIFVMAAGGLGLIGYALDFEVLYSWYAYGSVALHTAGGFTALGLALWLAAREPRSTQGEEVVIARRAIGLIVLAAAAIGIASLAAVVNQVKFVLAEGLNSTLAARTVQIRNTLESRSTRASIIPTQPELLRLLRRHADNPGESQTRAEIAAILEIFRGHGFTAITLTDSSGAQLARMGKPIEAAALALPMADASKTTLIWMNGAHLRHELPLADARGPLGVVVTEQSIPEMMRGLTRSEGIFGEKSELLLCGASRQGFSCLPTHRTPLDVVTLTADTGTLAALARRALDGERGFAAGFDSSGQRVLTSFAPASGRGLVTLLTVESAEFYQPLGQQFLLVLLLIGVTWLVGYFLVLRWVRPLAASLELRVHERTEALRNANVRILRDEQRFRAAIESAPTAMVMIDANGDIALVNAQTEVLFGYPREELLGQPVEILIPERLRKAHPESRGEFFAAPHARRMGAGRDLHGVRKDGSEVPVEIGLSPVQTEDGLLVLSTIVDISERKRNEQTLREANEALLRSNIELQRFAYIASHDLQTPMHTISSFVNLLRSKYSDRLDARANDWIRRTVDAIQALQVLVRDLLEYSRVDAQPHPFEPVSLREVFDHAVGLLDVAIREAGAQITCDELPVVAGDRSQLVQLTLNLIGNALKYRGTEPPRIHVWADRKGHEWQISVRDNGIGIAARHQERIFDIFKRLHDQQEYPGTGIGLAVCRRVVHRHGGRIWVDSEEGRGSVFHFTIGERIQGDA